MPTNRQPPALSLIANHPEQAAHRERDIRFWNKI